MPQVTATVSPTSISSQVQQLANDGTSGTMVVPALDSAGNPSKLSLFGQPGVGNVTGLQSSGPFQTAVIRGQPGATVATFATTATPATVATLTSVEVTLTPSIGTNPVWTVTTTDILVLNKPTAQAGIGYGNVRYASASTVGLSFNNITAGTLTPTATQIYGVVAMRGLVSAGTVSTASGTTMTITPAAVLTKTTAEQLFTLTGANPGELVIVNKPTVQAGLDIVGVRVAAVNQIGITFANFTAGTLTPTAGEAYTVLSTPGLSAIGTLLTFQGAVTGGTIATVTTGEITITSGNFAAQDQVVGVSKPTLQAGLMAGSGRVASSTTMAVTFANPTGGTLTPTAAEVLTTTIQRQNAAAPLVLYQATLTPTSVATLTTAEQTFTVTGLIAGSAVWVNKPSAQTGLGIVGARVSAANTLAVTFLNTTTGTLTPTAGEVYTVGNFQMPIDTTTANSWVQPALPALANVEDLANSMRSGLVAIGAIAGA